MLLRKPKVSACWLLAVMLLGGTSPAGEAVNFEKEMQPLLQQLCFDCHGPKQQKGDHRFDTLDPDLTNGDDAETWHDAFQRINLGEMPPPQAAQPAA